MRFPVFGVLAAAFALLPVAAAAAATASPAASPTPSTLVDVKPASLTFADGSGATQAVTVTNTGRAQLVFADRLFTVDSGFEVEGGPTTCGPPLDPNQGCKMVIKAVANGPGSGKLTIWDNGQDGKQTVALTISPPVSTPTPTPAPTPVPTPRGSIFLNPSSAPPSSKVAFSGSGLDAGRTLPVSLDGTQISAVDTDGNGSFNVQLTIPDNATGSSHQICVSETNGQVCAPFTLEAKPATPTPTDSATPTPSPSPSPSASPLTVPVLHSSGGGSTLLGFLARPPFVFLPIIAAAALLAFLALYFWRVRPAPPIGEVTILHRAPPPRVYGEPDPSPSTPSSAAPPAPPSPIVYESPSGPSAPPPPSPPPAPPSGADVPPEMPEASD